MARQRAKAKKPATDEISTALANVIEPDTFVVLQDGSEALEALAYNIQGEQIDEFDLDRVSVPAAGGLAFTLPDDDVTKEITGIMISVGVRRAYWDKPFGEENGPPVCSSSDGIRGNGDPGGDCASCPLNQFGTAKKDDGQPGRGKACRESRAIFMLRESDRLPLVVSAPASSLKGAKQYLMKLPVIRTRALTTIALVKDKSSDGVAYSRLVLSFVGKLPDSVDGPLRDYANAIGSAVLPSSPQAIDFTTKPDHASAVSDVMQQPNADDDAAAAMPDDDDEDDDEENDFSQEPALDDD